MKWRFDLGVFEGSWNGPGLTTNYLTAGNAGFKPQVEARLTAKGSNWQVFGAAHYSKLDLHGVDGETVTPIESGIKSTAYEVGGMMFNFQVNQNLFYALAAADCRPLVRALKATKPRPETAQWGLFLRNHDELDLGRLTEEQRQRVFACSILMGRFITA